MDDRAAAAGLISTAIEARREAQGVSVETLAKEMDLSASQLRALASGRDLPSLPTLKKVATFLGLKPLAVGRFVLAAEGKACGPKRHARRAKRKVPAEAAK